MVLQIYTNDCYAAYHFYENHMKRTTVLEDISLFSLAHVSKTEIVIKSILVFESQ